MIANWGPSRPPKSNQLQGEHLHAYRATQRTWRLRRHRINGLPGPPKAPGQTGQKGSRTTERERGDPDVQGDTEGKGLKGPQVSDDDGPPGQPEPKRDLRIKGLTAQRQDVRTTTRQRRGEHTFDNNTRTYALGTHQGNRNKHYLPKL